MTAVQRSGYKKELQPSCAYNLNDLSYFSSICFCCLYADLMLKIFFCASQSAGKQLDVKMNRNK